ncbi:Swt1 family HEPN domain-containing protein [Trujillonella humicola]|uniref:Swt1 family HEPN domain-containing protein n=1 Tax=Trujillonella humicola TaxID=3383699 RepID=UPI003905D247
MATSNRDRVGRAFERLAEALDEFVASAVAQAVPEGQNWTALLAARDAKKGITGKTYDRGDVQAQLRMLTENVGHALQPGWYPFDEKLSRSEKSLAEELRDTRNQWAHMKPFSADDAYRALDTAERFLRAIGAPADADAVRDDRMELRRLSSESQDRRVVTAMSTVGAEGLKPWREVLQPHRDVAAGNFQAAEFAADLHRVATGQAEGEYGDPVQFFNRTFLTDGLRDLLGGAARRIRGDANASPVVNLQTTFGGGKTHSMLSLWHLFSGTPVDRLPQEVQELVGDPGLPAGVSRAAIVGNHLAAGQVRTKPDGTRVHTLWGELAWQLGGAAGYARVADADATGTNPGTALHELLAEHAPAVILIDEWVAYARQLVGRDDDKLVGGTFETQFTFAQTLTEAASGTPGVLVVISIPASPDSEDDNTGVIDEEVGGENGRLALRRLQNAVRRVASQWRAASADEAFEIVRQRLFERPSPEALAHISATAKQFVEFYRKHSAEFPGTAIDNAYIDRIRRSYPVHPELFDRLYEDWSTLDRFQRTRGVLRLMNTVVGALWRAGDTAPLILPGSVPLSDDGVVTEITQYVEDQWKSVVDADVDGPQSVPRQVDEANKALLGSRLVTQRLARAIFLGATPTLHTANKGIDRRRVFLGTAVPGDVPGNFHSALNQLADQATYLYTNQSLYWYDTQANTSRTARDHAAGLHPEDVAAEVLRRLDAVRRAREGRPAVHLTADPAEVPDSDEFRLVVLPPQHVYERKSPTANAAVTAAHAVVDNRAGGARVRRNQLALLALDSARADDLDRAVRDYLGWLFVAEQAEQLGLSIAQANQARDRAKQADGTVTSRLLDGYTWLIVPTQQPGEPWTVSALRADASASSVLDRALSKLHRESELADEVAPAVIRMQLNRMPAAWEAGHVSVAALWDLFAQYPYLTRLTDRRVLEAGIAQTLNEPLGWEHSTFALAAGFDESAGRFVDLRLPGDSVPLAVTGTTLLVQPAAALAQRAKDEAERTLEADTETPRTDGTPTGQSGTGTGTGTWGTTGQAPGSTPAPKTRFFGVHQLDPQKYGKDFAVVVDEVLQRLTAAGAQLEVRLEISATKAEGFSDDVVRTVSENAGTLRFEQAGFERE